ncbi:matrilysin-like [Hydractinia symbiolongicarpus]|uniref:matrilysin-like n=1 Tax=Hydractinia symbiolongicarpus TaxID=13093 RepID=UPI00254FDFDA|nr:matrilysin-like [Hydractinia symbiolongicarpus]
MKLFILLVVAVVINCDVNVEDYLKQFGYYNPNSFDGKTLTESVKTFQKTFGLAATGVVDDETKKLMNTPRCGMADHQNNAFADKRWRSTALTYYYNNYTPDLDRNKVRELTKDAFKFWSDVTPLTFTEKSGGDIVISFGSGAHHDGRRTCGYPFDGKSGVLAHAFFPEDGRLHFDDAETYTYKSSSGTNYLWVATHELGHILGLEHDTNNKNAVMYPYYRPYNANGMKLHSNDIYRIQAQYGKSTGGGGPNPPPTPAPTQSACIDRVSNCETDKDKCDGYSDPWTEYMRKYCAKTCRKCSSGGNCKDQSSNCYQYKSKCKGYSKTWTDYMSEHCKKTCNVC